MITITGWQRPQLFGQLLASLAANDIEGWDILVQLEPSDIVDDYHAAAAEQLSQVSVSITVNKERLGIRNNPYSLLNRAFDDGADLLLYLEEDLLLARDAAALAQWYSENHRREWMCLSLLSGGCGSKGFISDRTYPEILFEGKSFNSLGFALRRDEWERHFRPAWLSDMPMRTCEGREVHGWDWSVYLHLIMTAGLYTLQPAAARATHTGKYGVYCKPEFHDSAFGGLDLAEGLQADSSYRVLTIESLPAPLRRQASLWDQTNSALRLINESIIQHKDKQTSRIGKSMIHTQVGTLKNIDGRDYVLANKGQSGCLLYGPYETLGPGKYCVRFNFSLSDENNIEEVDTICGRLEVSNQEQNILSRTNLYQSRLKERNYLEIEFNLLTPSVLEYRVYTNGKVSFIVDCQRKVKKLEDNAKPFAPMIDAGSEIPSEFFVNNISHFRNIFEHGGEVYLQESMPVIKFKDVCFFVKRKEQFQLVQEIFLKS